MSAPKGWPATAWIVGASSGIGAALARALAEGGSRVAISARSVEKLEALRGEFPDRIEVVPLDVTEASACSHANAEINRRFGAAPDLVVLAAGMWQEMHAQEFDAAVFTRTLSVNTLGTANVLGAILPGAITRGSGHIAVIASVAGYRGLPGASAYGASKAALINLCEALAPELARNGVRLRLINPGFVKTPMTTVNTFPMPFAIPAAAAAKRILRALTTSSRFEITFPKRLTWLLKFLRLLPYPSYFAITRRISQTPPS